MEHYKIKKTREALAYITDCNLATVSHMASLRSKSIGEWNRQVNIAQHGVDWIKLFEIVDPGNRAHEVLEKYNGIVREWAAQFKPNV